MIMDISFSISFFEKNIFTTQSRDQNKVFEKKDYFFMTKSHFDQDDWKKFCQKFLASLPLKNWGN